jgi:type IV pilus assembly protein PilW
MKHHPSRRRKQRGFTLIELMVALLLGLLVVAAAGSIFLSNRRVYGSTESLNRIQENQRAAFELLARDIREAGGNPCLRFGASKSPVVQLASFDSGWWGHFAAGIHGDGSGASDSITLYLANGATYPVVEHKKPGDPIRLGSVAGLVDGQVLMACNSDEAIVFSVSGISGNTLQHVAGANCGSGFTLKPESGKCGDSVAGPPYCFWGNPAVLPTAAESSNCQSGVGRSPAFVVRPFDVQWTVEANTRGGSSLYRNALGSKDEIAEGITDMTVGYKVGDASDYKSAGEVEAANAWARVTAVHVVLAFEAARGAMAKGDVQGVDGSALTRTLEDFIVLRNHQEGIQ